MKNIFSIAIVAAAASMLSACYGDDSTANYKTVNPITIVDQGADALSIYPLDTLRIKPISYKEGRSDADLTFSWTLHNQNIVPTVLGEEMTLKAKMNFQPMGAPYRLVYRVTDPASGLFVEKIYSVTVMSPFGTGLIVCDSRDGQTSDVSLCMHRNFLTGSVADTVMRNLFSAFNGRNIDGADHVMVVAGSDKRGTIYGVYEISRQIGVSPWYWWADVPVRQQENLFVKPGVYTDGEPQVRYRGIFINDEAPAFQGWCNEKFGGVNSRMYEHMFELILRQKGNFLWPAMWGNMFFYDDPRNGELANDMGIVIGTTHHEPMGRAHEEWKVSGSGDWNERTCILPPLLTMS